MQSSFWEDFKKKTGWDSISLGLFDDEKLVGGAAVLRFHFSKNGHFLYIPQGPVLDYDSANAEQKFVTIIESIKNNLVSKENDTSHTSHLRIEPRIMDIPSYFSAFHRASFDMQPSYTLLVDLAQSEEELLANMKPKGRYNIGVAQRHSVTVDFEPCTQEDLALFYALYLETSKHHAFTPQPIAYFSSMISSSASSHSSFAFARHEDRILSAAFIITFGTSATYFYGASSSESPEFMAPYLLQWETMRHMKQLGFMTYDFWGVAPKGANEDHPWHGFSKFKEKFGGTPVRFIGAHDLVFGESTYRDYLSKSGEKSTKSE